MPKSSKKTPKKDIASTPGEKVQRFIQRALSNRSSIILTRRQKEALEEQAHLIQQQLSISPSTDSFSSAGDESFEPITMADERFTPYKTVITWIDSYDGSRDQYLSFSSDCDRCFAAIDPKEASDLINFVLKFFDVRKFPLVRGTTYRSWAELKKALDEHFRIRRSESQLFREMLDLKKAPGEESYGFYNKLLAKCSEYKTFISINIVDADKVKFKIQQAEELILEFFIQSIPTNLRLSIIQQKPKTIQEAYKMLREIEMETGCRASDNDNSKLDEVLQLLKNTQIKEETHFSDPKVCSNNMQSRKVCQLCNKPGHLAPDCRLLSDQGQGHRNSNNSGNNNNSNNNNRFNRTYDRNRSKRNFNNNNNSNWNNGPPHLNRQGQFQQHFKSVPVHGFQPMNPNYGQGQVPQVQYVPVMVDPTSLFVSPYGAMAMQHSSAVPTLNNGNGEVSRSSGTRALTNGSGSQQ